MAFFKTVGTIAAAVGAITPGLPANTKERDILVMFIETGDQAITVSGWTEAPNSPQSDATDATRLSVFWKRVVGGDNLTTSDSGNHQIGRIIAVRGAVLEGDPFNVTAGGTDSTSDTTADIPGAVTTVPNCLVLAAVCHGIDVAGADTAEYTSWANSNLVGLTERIDNRSDVGNGGGIGVAVGTYPLIGNYGTTTVTQARNGRKALWSGAIMPYIPPHISSKKI